jgi:hypothetical protein
MPIPPYPPSGEPQTQDQWRAWTDGLRARISKLEADEDETEALRDKMRDILNRTAVALHGGPLEMGQWSWHDLPELAERAVAYKRSLLLTGGGDGPVVVKLDDKAVFSHMNLGVAENKMATLQWHLDQIEKAIKGGA